MTNLHKNTQTAFVGLPLLLSVAVRLPFCRSYQTG